MNQDKARKVLSYLESLRTGVAVWKLGAFDGLNDVIAIMREEAEQRCKTCDGAIDVHGIDGEYRGQCPWCAPQAPAEPISDAEIFDLWARSPGKDPQDALIRFARALLERTK